MCGAPVFLLDLISNHGFDSRARRASFKKYVYIVYQVWNSAYYSECSAVWRMAGWLLLEAAQMLLSNVRLFDVSYDTMRHFSRMLCPCFTRNDRILLYWAECKKNKNKSNTILFLEHALDCCARGIWYNAPYLRLCDYLPRTLSEFRWSPGPAPPHTRLVRRAQINDRGRNKVLPSVLLHLPWTIND